MTAGRDSGRTFPELGRYPGQRRARRRRFCRSGLGEDDSVALMLRNDFPTFEANFAAGQLGIYAVPINWHFTPEEAAYILADSGAKVLVAHSDLLAQIASGVPEHVKVLVVPTPGGDRRSLWCAGREARCAAGLEAGTPSSRAAQPNTQPPKMARGSMIYTSASTGRRQGRAAAGRPRPSCRHWPPARRRSTGASRPIPRSS